MSEYMLGWITMPIEVTEKTLVFNKEIKGEEMEITTTEELVFQHACAKSKEKVGSDNPDDRIEFLITKNNSPCDPFELRVNKNKYTTKRFERYSTAIIWGKEYINLEHGEEFKDVMQYFRLFCESDITKMMRYFRCSELPILMPEKQREKLKKLITLKS